MMKYQLTIPKPCHENWSKMSSTEKGKFCKSCKKEVFDFTKKSDSEITKMVKGTKNICGRFKQNQLERDIEVLRKNHFSKIAASFVLISTIAVSEPLFSQSKNETITIIERKNDAFFIKNDSIEKNIIIKGIVKDTLGEALPGVNIHLKETKTRAETDFDGNFSIKIPNKKGKSIILVVSYLGYKNKEIDILSIKKPLEIILEEDESILGGMLITTGMIATKKPSIIQRCLNVFRKKENRRN